MKSRVFTTILLILLLMGLTVSPVSAAQNNTYTITDLGPGVAYDINDRGQIVGASTVIISGYEVEHAFLWNDGAMIDLGTLGGEFSRSAAGHINNHGQIAGRSQIAADCAADP